MSHKIDLKTKRHIPLSHRIKTDILIVWNRILRYLGLYKPKYRKK